MSRNELSDEQILEAEALQESWIDNPETAPEEEKQCEKRILSLQIQKAVLEAQIEAEVEKIIQAAEQTILSH